ncbi:Fic family protein [Angustibacter sp. McL0619]|uniref:Fic family protein n=1 Tax=Angustibacter sp. McL0619 TaxID=3415676 RepID=UPI003CF57359
MRTATFKLISEAERELGRLDAQVRALPNPRLLLRPALSREAVSTSALEGTFAPLSEVFAAEHLAERKQTPEVREIQNYTNAAVLGLKLITSKPICFSVAAELQAELVRGTRGESFDSGQMRKRLVCIGDSGRGIENSRFVPAPSGPELVEGISAWEKWVNSDNDMPFIARLALSHYQFETLHPFSDGNGRIGRLLISLQLVEDKVLQYPVLNLSSWLEPRRQEYTDQLLNVSATGDYDAWIAFFARGVREQAVTSSETVSRLVDTQTSLIERVLAAGKKGVIVELARDLIGSPVVSVSDVRKKFGIANTSARSVVLALVELEILRPIEGITYGKLYMCQDVYRALTD